MLCANVKVFVCSSQSRVRAIAETREDVVKKVCLLTCPRFGKCDICNEHYTPAK